MDDIVNALRSIQRTISGSGISITFDQTSVHIAGLHGSVTLKLIRLYRPSSHDVEREASEDALLVITAATRKAAAAAARYNHILVPEGGYRIVAPGVALMHDSYVSPETSRLAQLAGRSGVIAETLLLGKNRAWSVRDLAAAAHVSSALTHRVMVRLERENLLVPHGSGRVKSRVLSNPRALAELWSQEESIPSPALRGFLYTSSTEALSSKITDGHPETAVGGVLAANLYKPLLTRVSPPLRVWVPSDFDFSELDSLGFQPTNEGANVEFLKTKHDAWQVNMSRAEKLPCVSKWRAWLEVASTTGRSQELADALFAELSLK